MSNDSDTAIQSIEWRKDHLRILDQTYLPGREVYSDIRDVGRIWEAIQKERIRGASAIGIAAAYGLYLGIKELPNDSFHSFSIEVKRLSEYLASSRPSVRNLQWSLNRIQKTIQAHNNKEIAEIKDIVLKTAITIDDETKRGCKKIGEHGMDLIPEKARILTHANTGSLATGKYGTALSAIFHAHENNTDLKVWVSETRPLLQGARLTAWELKNAEIPLKLITDSTAGLLMRQEEVDMLLVGSDHIAANGDSASNVGSYPLAVLAKENNIPFYVAAPFSTIDMELQEGDALPHEDRESEEVTHFEGTEIAPSKVEAYNPAFDITPNKYITAFITEKGIVEPPFEQNFKDHLK